MICFVSTFLQCFVCLILLWWPAFIDSFPSKNLALNSNNHGRRFQRDDNSGTVFSVGEDLDLVLQNGNKYLEFEICCNKNDGCHPGHFLFCFQTTEQKQSTEGLYGCGANTCAYKIEYNALHTYFLSVGRFTTSDSCFKGKIDNEKVYATYSNGDPLNGKNNDGCPLNITLGNRLKLEVKSIPSNVVVKALNAEKYVEPTLPPPTPPPTEGPKELSSEPPKPAEKEKEETAMSDALKYSLIGIGIFVAILVLVGLGFAIYCFCCKPKKSSKPVAAPTVTVVPTEKPADATTPITPKEESAPAPEEEKPSKPKPKAPKKKKAKKEVSKVEAAPTPSNIVTSSVATEPPPPPTASKEPTIASKEPTLVSKDPTLASKEPTASKDPTFPHTNLDKQLLPTPTPSAAAHVPQPFKYPDAPKELPPANPTMVELIERGGRPYRGRTNRDTFEKILKPQYEDMFESMVRQKWIDEDETIAVGHGRNPTEDEIRLFALPISRMYAKLEEMIDQASKQHKQHDNDEKCHLIHSSSTPHFVRYFAIVLHFAIYFKIEGENDRLKNCSIPLLLAIAMDRNQSERIRRRALVEMTKKAVNLKNVFVGARCDGLPYPMNVIFLSYKFDHYLPNNAPYLHTFSSPNNSECGKSNGSTKKKNAGDGVGARVSGVDGKGGVGAGADRGGAKKKSSTSTSSKSAKTSQTSVSKEKVIPVAAVEKKKKKKMKKQ